MLGQYAQGRRIAKGRHHRRHSLGDQAKQSKTQEWCPVAIQEFRRLHETLFYLDYISNESLRLRIRSTLNKGELLHSLARDLFFGQQELFRVRDYEASSTVPRA